MDVQFVPSPGIALSRPNPMALGTVFLWINRQTRHANPHICSCALQEPANAIEHERTSPKIAQRAPVLARPLPSRCNQSGSRWFASDWLRTEATRLSGEWTAQPPD